MNLKIFQSTESIYSNFVNQYLLHKKTIKIVMCKGNTFMAENARLPNKILYFCAR